MKTTWINEQKIKREWYLVDAGGKIIGRVATKIASLLIGKGKVNRVPNIDCGDYVVVINTDKIKFTGNKAEQKMYYRHSGYPGGLTVTSLSEMLDTKSENIIKLAVKNMLPKNKWRDQVMSRLHVYKTSEHKHKMHNPKLVD
ncbi:50S ribosomal protein L13 [Candidatus Dojkabacteria bacterium]|nr:50S ribosomal protein L13 [Candidatus Dojkabacteria bacterium]